MATVPAIRSRRRAIWAGGLALAVAGCVQPQATIPVATTPVPAGQARVWFYRDYQPSESPNLARVDMNGAYVGAVANGGAFFRDVPAGHYHIAPESFGEDFGQQKDVDLAAGRELYVKIASLRDFGSACRDCLRDTFYAWLIPPEVAQVEISRDRSGI